MEHFDELLDALNNFSLSVDATPMVLRQQRGETLNEDTAPMQPRLLLNDQTNQSLLSQEKETKLSVDSLGSRMHATLLSATDDDNDVKSDEYPVLAGSGCQSTTVSDWVSNMRQAVHQWVHQERQLIACERAQIAGQMESYKEALERLQKKFDELRRTHHQSLHHFEQVQERDRELIMHQQARIKQLERQVEVKGLSENVPAARPIDGARQTPTPHPQAAPFFAESDEASEPSQRVEDGRLATRRYKIRSESGNEVICYSSGATKEILPDGSTEIRFTNGDIQTHDVQTKTTSYYFADSQVTKSMHPEDGSTIYEFQNGQVERHFQDGRKLVEGPDGARFWVGKKEMPIQVDDYIDRDQSLLTDISNAVGDKYAVLDF